MKKLLFVLLTLNLIYVLAACGGKEMNLSTTDNESVSSESMATEFEKPADYASVLLVTINPQFKLYLDENNNVLAVEAVNKDAESMKNDINLENENFETVIQTIVTTANESGFIKEETTINFEVTETKKSNTNTTDILNGAVDVANQTATDLKITVIVKTNDKDNNKNTEEQVKEESTNKQPITSSDSNNGNEPSTSNNNEPTHVHSFSSASCTEPKRCSCGVMEGTALGHKWTEATCKSPQKCSVCGIETGSVTNHVYSNGNCSVCGIKDVTDPSKTLKYNVTYVTYDSFDDSNSQDNRIEELCFINNSNNIYCSTFTTYWYETSGSAGEQPFVYNGKTYYGGDGGGEPYSYEFVENKILLYNDQDKFVCSLVVQNNGELRVVSSENSRYRVNSIFVLKK